MSIAALASVDECLSTSYSPDWLLDPPTHRAYVCTGTEFREPVGGILEVPGTAIRIPLAELFAED